MIRKLCFLLAATLLVSAPSSASAYWPYLNYLGYGQSGYGLGYNYRQEFPRLVNKVTRADVLRVARQYLDPEHYTLVVVGPERTGNGKGAAK